MVAAPAQADYAKLLFRTEPFSKMASARRFQLLSQARSVRFVDGEHVFPTGQPPVDVLLLLGGKVRIVAEMPGQDEPVHLGEYLAGSCVGWDIALADVCGVQAVAVGEVVGLLVSAPSFIEIARFDPELRDSFLFRPSSGEVWWAILSELQRRELPIDKAGGIVAQIAAVCTTRDWPEEESAIQSRTNYLWIVSGGEGVLPGTPWGDSTGVLWARLIGVPKEQFGRALEGGDAVCEDSRGVLKSGVRAAPETSSSTPSHGITESNPPKGNALVRVLKGTVYLVLVITALSAMLCGWASRQPTIEKMATEGRLIFSGDVHEVSATVSGKMVESKLRAGQRVEKGEVLAIIQPLRDEAKDKALAETLARAKGHVDLCERILAGNAVRPNEAPENISANVRDLNALKSEHRIKTAINSGRADDRALTPDERARVNTYFDTVKADRAARVDVAQTDSSIKREDLADAEQALREAKEDLRLQTDAASALTRERGDEAKAEAASAQRAIGIYKRTVAMKQDAVARIRKEIASIRVAPAAMPVTAPQSVDRIEAAIQEHEKSIRKFSASMRVLAVETEIAIDEANADAAPRQITTLYPGLVTHTELVAPQTPVSPETVLGKMVTRQAWEIECPAHATHFLKPGQEITIISPAPDGTGSRISAQFSQTLPGATKGKSRISHKASNDTWRDGTAVKIEALVVTGNLLDRWLAQISMISP